MSKARGKISNLSDLRKRAEALLSKSEERISDMSIEDIKRLVHELDTHQIELELQNEDLKNAQLLLEKTRKNYYELFDLAPCGYLKLNQNGIIIEANLTSTELLGIAKTNLVNRKFTDFILDDYQDNFYRIYSGKNNFNARKNCELKLKKGKKDFWVHLELKFLKTAEDSSYSYLITLCDISQQKYLQFFNDLSRNINDAIFFINPENSKFIDINEQAVKSLGYKRSELLNMGVIDIEAVIPDNFSWEKHVDQVYKAGNLLIEGIHKRKNGTVFPVEVNIAATTYSNQKYIIAIARDITNRKKAEKELDLTEKRLKNVTEKLQSILKNIPEVVYSAKADPKGTILYISDRWKEWTGYSPEESYLNSAVWAESIHPEDRKAAVGHYAEAISSGRENTSEYRLVNKITGEERWVYDHGIPIKNSRGRTVRYDGIVTDITERKKSEQIIIQSQKMHATGTLAGGMAHEFNNIIGVIMGYTQILIESKCLTEELKDGLNIIYKQGEKAAEIIDNILKFSRKKDIDFDLINLGELLNDTIKIIRLLLPLNITIICDIDKDLPLIKGNSTQLQQALINLSNNSIHAMGEKKGILKFSLGLEDSCSHQKSQTSSLSNNCLKLCIEDEGCGMSDDAVNQIFDPFFTTKAPGKGTGLGLSVVHGIIKAHKGEISLKSRQNAGTEICMFFPPALKGMGISHSAPRSPSHGIERILIVEDEVDMLEFLSISLSRLGYRVTEALSGIEALEIYRKAQDRIDLVVSDYAMPLMTGIELYDKLSDIKKDIPFILITGYKDINLEKYLNKKKLESLYKPIYIVELTGVIRSYFDR